MTRWKNCYFPPYVYKHMCECLCGILCDPNHHHLFASSTTHRAMLWVDGGILSWASDNFSSCRQEGLLRGRDIWNTPTYMKNFYNSIPLRISIFQFFFSYLKLLSRWSSGRVIEFFHCLISGTKSWKNPSYP